ncbi:formimidoylglutamate deiminase [Parasphingopyxis sp.]|uniref:formimidoylglutamate deiminase n=1 Tax=Parasphingopyxis sp. TaxID=1920299 RepID=UPI002634DD1B|nr:formimidoylglutamate deiminase [Parasphingopyxis sp.]
MTQLWFETALLPGGWERHVRLRLDAGRIMAVEANTERKPDDEAHGIAIPGLVNVHSHGFQRALAGRTERRGPSSDSFWTWREVMYRFLDRLTPDDVEAITAQAYAEMLEAGFVRVAEFHYLHHDADGAAYGDRAEIAARIAAAAGATGIGLTLLPVFYAHGGFGGADPSPGQRRFLNDLDGYAALLEGSRGAVRKLDGGNIGIAPHSLRAATEEELVALTTMDADCPMHIHIAEQEAEVEACLAWSGHRPVEWLFDRLAIDGRWTLIHATHVTPSEIEAIAASGAVAGLCPITEANLGDGLFPLRAFLDHAGAIAIGSDSNVMIDAALELQQLEYGQRLAENARNIGAGKKGGSTGGDLFRAALAGGHRSMCSETVGLEPGAPADIVSLDPGHPALAGLDSDALLDAWVFSGGRGVVDGVWCFGREEVRGGRHRDAERIAQRYRAVMERLGG